MSSTTTTTTTNYDTRITMLTKFKTRLKLDKVTVKLILMKSKRYQKLLLKHNKDVLELKFWKEMNRHTEGGVTEEERITFIKNNEIYYKQLLKKYEKFIHQECLITEYIFKSVVDGIRLDKVKLETVLKKVRFFPEDTFLYHVAKFELNTDSRMKTLLERNESFHNTRSIFDTSIDLQPPEKKRKLTPKTATAIKEGGEDFNNTSVLIQQMNDFLEKEKEKSNIIFSDELHEDEKEINKTEEEEEDNDSFSSIL